MSQTNKVDAPISSLPIPISDEELRSRAQDLLTAEGHFDRVIREACVILEDRVRRATGQKATLLGVKLMQEVLGEKGPLRLSEVPAEQVGAMELFKGTMSFFRNAAGHHLIEGYTRDDAIRFLAWVDLLLELVARAMEEQERLPKEEEFLSRIPETHQRQAARDFLSESETKSEAGLGQAGRFHSGQA